MASGFALALSCGRSALGRAHHLPTISTVRPMKLQEFRRSPNYGTGTELLDGRKLVENGGNFTNWDYSIRRGQNPGPKARGSKMALTRDFKETVSARVARRPVFAKALLDEAATLFLNGDRGR